MAEERNRYPETADEVIGSGFGVAALAPGFAPAFITSTAGFFPGAKDSPTPFSDRPSITRTNEES